MACIVLHNILHNMKEIEDWLEVVQDREEEEEGPKVPARNERYVEIQQAGICHRDEL